MCLYLQTLCMWLTVDLGVKMGCEVQAGRTDLYVVNTEGPEFPLL